MRYKKKTALCSFAPLCPFAFMDFRRSGIYERTMKTDSAPALSPQREENLRLVRRSLLQAAAYPFLFGLVLFLPAGTLAWPLAWTLLAVYIGGMLLTNLWLIARHPGLARERLIIPRSSERWDLRLTGIVNFILLAVLLPLCGWDHRYGLSPAVPIAVSLAALLIFLAMFFFMAWAMSANAFFSSAVRLQSDRRQTVATRGPYRILRHPGYLAMILQFLAIPIALGSLWGMIPAAAVNALYVYRTDREDRFLLDKLSGYAEYSRQVPFRLIPGIW
jgi:protein-S-isoprenylcysteine O-methyltransferase Ste14